ncbi:alpha/beta-hydrolase family protein [Rhizobium sp. KVB221]|uniref:Alpha/beta-hydrolase family protein n=1 Tax=Rhizobium setariae TaxID=2801340 RepID=A0A937CRE3_9HYPH|nr:alpha/beta-hydrolase family protein [Rhizobium setariae]MBL0375338.1 alpha/beta-hydrolase family protein [Rhizobium setariae]
MRSSISRLFGSLSTIGLLFGFLFFAASLTPSLMPRSYVIQGALSGVCSAIGYLFGVWLVWLYGYLQLPVWRDAPRAVKAAVIAAGLLISVYFISLSTGWQNSIRSLWGMDRIESAEPFKLALIAALIFIIALIAGRLFYFTWLAVSRWLAKFVPPRISNVVGGFVALALFWSAVEGVLLRAALHVADSSFQKVDALIEDKVPMPLDPGQTGSSASLVAWDGLGRQGRSFIASGPAATDIEAFWKEPARKPVRVYVGLNNTDTIDKRAKLALEELKRQDAFSRPLLVVVVPTGTGWVDEAAIDTLEYLHHGDVASVAVQYSYLASWLSLMVEPEYGAESAKALFREVYRHWTALPHDKRPKLYLYGLSLGALNSQLSVDFFDIVGDPFQGALWSGPPFASRMWTSVTANRDPQTPAWLPRFRDGSIIRFTSQKNALDIAGATWGAMRIVYLQYASDPITFFDIRSSYREPDWMKSPRGPDVSPGIVWIPGLTMLQLAFDMAIATTSPMGYGHVYAPQHYIDAWIAVTAPTIDQDHVESLKRHFDYMLDLDESKGG